MASKLIRYLIAALIAAGFFLEIQPEAAAQTGNSSIGKQELRARQAAIYQQMLAEPENLDLMFSYAGVSARLEDYEAAISTLERMLIFNADLPRVRLELGALYFRLGADPVAERYFRSVAERPDLPKPVAKRVGDYLKKLEERQRKHRFSGRVEAGIIADTNANLGPDDRGVLLFGQPALLTQDSVGNEDIGLRLLAELTHIYDLGGTRTDHWRTDASFLGKHYESEGEGNLDSFYIRTGPRLSVTAETFGPKIRPFIDAEYTRADDDSLYRGAGAGVEFRAAPADEWSVFGELRGGYRDYLSRDDEDGVVGRARLGLGFLPARDVLLGASLTLQRDDAKEDFNSNSEGVLRLSASYAYDPGFSFVDDKWVLTAFASAGLRWFDDPDPTIVGQRSREDHEFRLGASHLYNFRDGFYGSIGASALWRDSNIPNFDLENFGLSLSLGYKF